MRVIGHGPAPALAVHCTLAHGGAWAPVAAHLLDKVTLLAPDLPGHGSAPPWERGGDYLAACRFCLAPALDRSRHVIGHSFGAVVALAHALDHPDLVLSLTLIDPVLFAAAPTPEARAAAAAERDELARHFGTDDREAAAEYFNRIWGPGPGWDDLPEPARRRAISQIHIIPDQSPPLHEDSAGLLAPGRLEGFDRPTLLIEGGDSPPVMAGIVAALAARLPAARRVTVPGAGHMAPLTHPEEVAAAMSSLLVPCCPA